MSTPRARLCVDSGNAAAKLVVTSSSADDQVMDNKNNVLLQCVVTPSCLSIHTAFVKVYSFFRSYLPQFI